MELDTLRESLRQGTTVFLSDKAQPWSLMNPAKVSEILPKIPKRRTLIDDEQDIEPGLELAETEKGS